MAIYAPVVDHKQPPFQKLVHSESSGQMVESCWEYKISIIRFFPILRGLIGDKTEGDHPGGLAILVEVGGGTQK